MVVLQQGVNTVLSFGAKSVKPELLEEMLIGRSATVEQLHKAAKGFALEGLNQQLLLIGPRGSGKTHILRVLFHRIQGLIQKKKLVVAYFSEDEYGISGYLDFLIRVINSFIRWHEADAAHLQQKFDELRQANNSVKIDVAEQIITDYIGDKPLLILAENFDIILENIGVQGQAKLRSILYRHNKISIIATSQAMSKDLGREDRPFYNFFTPIYLKKLSYEDSLLLLQTLAKVDGRLDIVELLNDKGRYQVRAIHEMVKGNHRLLVTFYEFLKADTIASISTLFMKTMNDLKPYYESFIRYLPPQEQKILYYLALAKTPRRGTEIANDCFIVDKSISKLLSELQRKKLLESYTDPSSKRDRLYDIAEPLLRIGIEIGEQKEGVVGLFIDFMALYYSMDELGGQKDRFERMWRREADPVLKNVFYDEIQARSRAIRAKQKIQIEQSGEYKFKEEVYKLHREEKYAAFIESAKKVDSRLKDAEYYFLLGISFSKMSNIKKAIQAYEYCITIDHRYPKARLNLGVGYFLSGEAAKAEKQLKIYVESNPDDFNGYFFLGISLFAQLKYLESIDYLEKSLSISGDSPRSYIYLGYLQYLIGNKAKAGIEFWIKALDEYPDLVLTHALRTIQRWDKEVITMIKLANNRDSLEQLYPSFILNLLSTDINIDEEQILFMQRVITESFGSPSTMQILKSFLDVFSRMIFYNEERAIYNLPKEQREFFMKEVITRRLELIAYLDS